MLKLQTYLNFAGNSEEAFNFYKATFGGEFSSLVRFKDMPMPGVTLPTEVENKIMHISLPIGQDNILMATDAIESLGHQLIQGNNVNIFVQPDSKEAADKLFNALSSGGNVEMPMTNQPWGDYYGSFQDKFGTCWMVSYTYVKAD
jgi:PhnB protein